ncbi:MAG: thiamine phosphate synthase [Pseudomonadota bacterium]
MTAPRCQLYLVTPPVLEPTAFRDTLAAALDAGPVACVQLRLKGAGEDAIRRACDALRPAVQSRDVAFLLNDRPDLAAEAGCDGVHIGQQDASVEAARAAVGKERIIGVTCHASRHLAIVAAEAGADYVAFGAFFPSATKEEPAGRADPELLAWWHELMTVPCVAIGGIAVDNCGPLVAAGADFLAVASGVWEYPHGPARAVADFNAAIERHSR